MRRVSVIVIGMAVVAVVLVAVHMVGVGRPPRGAGNERGCSTQAAVVPQLGRDEVIARISGLGGSIDPAFPFSERLVYSVDLRGPLAGDADLPMLGAFPELKGLRLSGGGFTDAGIPSVLALREIQVLDVSGTRITSAGMKGIGSLRHLTRLAVRDTAVTGEGLSALVALPALGFLDVSGTKIQESDVVNLRGIRSRLAIEPFPQEAVIAWLCEGEFETTPWARSGDRKLSLRLLARKRQYEASDDVMIMGELRNDSDSKLLVLRPFGDARRAQEQLLEIRGPDGFVNRRIRELASRLLLGGGLFAALAPGETIRDSLVVKTFEFSGFDVVGSFRIKFKYDVSEDRYGSYAKKYAVERWPDLGESLWTGAIASEEVKITKGCSSTEGAGVSAARP